MILFAVFKEDGTFEGEHCCVKRVSKQHYFDNFTPPPGHIKKELTIDEYNALKFSWNRDDEIADRKLNVQTNRLNKLSKAEKNKCLKARPKKFRERIKEHGDVERVEFEDPRNIDWSKSRTIRRKK